MITKITFQQLGRATRWYSQGADCIDRTLISSHMPSAPLGSFTNLNKEIENNNKPCREK